MTRVFSDLESFKATVETSLGSSSWTTVTQGRIDAFADTTGDRQWIHTDPERSAAGPFGSTIAHGYLTLSLVPAFIEEIFSIESLALAVNYGTDRVRFPSVVPVGARLRGHAKLLRCTDTSIGTQATIHVVVEEEGGDKPACVAEVVYVLAEA